MSDLAVVGLGVGLAYMAYRQVTTKAKDIQEYQAGLFKESDLKDLDSEGISVDRLDYNAEAPDPSVDRFVGKYKARRRNKPIHVGPDTKPAIF